MMSKEDDTDRLPRDVELLVEERESLVEIFYEKLSEYNLEKNPSKSCLLYDRLVDVRNELHMATIEICNILQFPLPPMGK